MYLHPCLELIYILRTQIILVDRVFSTQQLSIETYKLTVMTSQSGVIHEIFNFTLNKKREEVKGKIEVCTHRHNLSLNN